MLTVLETVAAQGPATTTDVARLCGINRTVAHRLLSTLAEKGYVRRTDSGYRVGPTAVTIASAFDGDMKSLAQPLMDRLAEETGETVVLHAIDHFEAVVVSQSRGLRHIVRVEHRPGSRHPLFLGASGWSLLAFQSPRRIASILKKAPDAVAAAARIEQTRADGYAISHDELQLGVHGLAFPLIEASGSCQFSLGILLPSSRADILGTFIEPLGAVARQICALGS